MAIIVINLVACFITEQRVIQNTVHIQRRH